MRIHLLYLDEICSTQAVTKRKMFWNERGRSVGAHREKKNPKKFVADALAGRPTFTESDHFDTQVASRRLWDTPTRAVPLARRQFVLRRQQRRPRRKGSSSSSRLCGERLWVFLRLWKPIEKPCGVNYTGRSYSSLSASYHTFRPGNLARSLNKVQ